MPREGCGWEVFRLSAIEQQSGKEVAAMLKIPVAHVYVYKQRVQDAEGPHP